MLYSLTEGGHTWKLCKGPHESIASYMARCMPLLKKTPYVLSVARLSPQARGKKKAKHPGTYTVHAHARLHVRALH